MSSGWDPRLSRVRRGPRHGRAHAVSGGGPVRTPGIGMGGLRPRSMPTARPSVQICRALDGLAAGDRAGRLQGRASRDAGPACHARPAFERRHTRIRQGAPGDAAGDDRLGLPAAVAATRPPSSAWSRSLPMRSNSRISPPLPRPPACDRPMSATGAGRPGRQVVADSAGRAAPACAIGSRQHAPLRDEAATRGRAGPAGAPIPCRAHPCSVRGSRKRNGAGATATTGPSDIWAASPTCAPPWPGPSATGVMRRSASG